MLSSLKTVYGALPSKLRSLAASGYGYYLKSWRYSSDTEKLVEEALARETWTKEQWRSWQQTQLAELLQTAATTVPYYREQWRARRRSGDESPWDELANWPVLSKDALRENPEAFVCEDADIKKLYKLSTSGTSGKPITVWRSRKTMRDWYAIFEARWRYWHGVSRHDNWAILGGQLVTPVEQKKPPYWVWNAGLNQLYMSSLHLSPSTVAAYLEALKSHNIVYLWGYASSMHNLAHMALEQGLKGPKLKVAISNAELLHPYQRESISAAFGCPVINTYGMSEAVAGAGECAYGTMHLWPDAGVVEIFNDDKDEPVDDGIVGRILCTGLTNKEMPLIRYEVGDRGSRSEGSCGCGRTLPVLDTIEGRVTDNLITADGRKIFWLNPVFYGLPIQEAQIIQEALDRIVIKVVPAQVYSEQDTNEILNRMKKRMGEVPTTVELVDEIPRSANGKFRAVINKVAS